MEINQRHILILLLGLFFCSNSMAQYQPPYKKDNSSGSFFPIQDQKAYYLGFGSGLYGKFGLFGVNASLRVNPSTLAEVNIGLGNWGLKTGIAISGLGGPKTNWIPSFGITLNSGYSAKNIECEVSLPGSRDITVRGDLTYKPILILHASVIRQFFTKKGNRFFLEMGYSMAVNTIDVVFSDQQVDFYGTKLNTSDLQFSERQKALNALFAPNGINLSFGYQFGFGKYN